MLPGYRIFAKRQDLESQGLASPHPGNPRQPRSRFQRRDCLSSPSLNPSRPGQLGPGGGAVGKRDPRPSSPRSRLRSPEPPSGCWTAPTPACPCPGSPASRNSRARAARGRRRGPAAPWRRTAEYLWRRGSSRAAATGRRRAPARSWPEVRCSEPALSLRAGRRPRSSPPLHLSTPTFPLPLRRPPHVLPAAYACVV